MKSRFITAACFLACISTASSAIIFNSFSTYTEDFNDYRGTSDLPAGFSFSVDSGNDIYRGVFNSNTNSASDFTGVMAATSDGINHSLVWRESTGPASLDDGRLFLTITNNTGSAITGFNISYDVQSWVNGNRDNQMRLKYDTLVSSPDRSTFETDVFATINPNHTPIASNGDQFVLDGTQLANYFTVTGFVDLTTLLIDENDPSAGTFGPLASGETAYIRWQISNADLTNGNRSALGIDNLSITPIPEPTTALLGALGMLALLRRRR